jgi:glycosyltransferase involved in cell wall biosynthesis
MGRDVPPKVTYWTGTWDPRREAISKEIELLRELGGRRAPVISFSSGQGARLEVGNRVVCLSASQWPLLRALAPLAERTGDVNHVFGSLDAWHLLRSVRRKPTILTVVLPGQPGTSTLPAHVRCFVAESEAIADTLRKSGVAEDRLRLIYPGVDLHQYRPGPPPAGPFRIIFASTPADPAEFDARGIGLLVELARHCPDIDVVLLWRSWGNRDLARQALERLRPPANLKVEERNGRDMPDVYRSAHAVAALYQDGFGKSCPNSVVEALACGLPALVSKGCGIARLVEQSGAGLAAPRDIRAIVLAARALQRHAQPFGRAARALAEAHFAIETFIDGYVRLYDEVALVGQKARELRIHRVDKRDGGLLGAAFRRR